MTDGIIEAWCKGCKKLGPVDETVRCASCRSKEADRRRWSESINWSADGSKGGPIYGASFPEPDDEEAPLCTRCRDLGKCGVIAVDDEHLLSGCDLFVKRGTSREEKNKKLQEFIERWDHEAYEEDIGRGIKAAGERLGLRTKDSD